MNSRFYKGKKVLITGGTGFLGANLAEALVKQGAIVTLLSQTDKGLGSIQDVLDLATKLGRPIEIVLGDIRDAVLMRKVVAHKDIIYNLAAKVSHLDKGVVSYEDLDVNVRGQLTFLEAVRAINPQAKIIFSSTRMVYGENVKSPVKESHPTNPTTFYGIHKLMAEKYHTMYNKRHGLKTTILRIGNPYGDRQHFSNGLYSLPGWFMKKAMAGETTEILSDGKQSRDYIYIGDLVELLLRVGATDATNGMIYNAGSGQTHTFKDMVDAISSTVKNGTFIYAPNPHNSKSDSYLLDSSALFKVLKWKPKIKLKAGVKKMHTFAQKHK